MSADPDFRLLQHRVPPALPPEDLGATSAEFDDDPWDVFLADGDSEPLPEPGDFWVE